MRLRLAVASDGAHLPHNVDYVVFPRPLGRPAVSALRVGGKQRRGGDYI